MADLETKAVASRVFLDVCLKGSIESVKRVLRAHPYVDVNCQDAAGATPLLMAVRGGNIDIVRYLINKNASTKHKTKLGNSVLHWACLASKQDLTILSLLLSQFPSQESIENVLINDYGETCLMTAAFHGKIGYCKEFIKLGSGILDAVNHIGDTALHVALKEAQTDAVEFLLSEGASPDIANQSGDSVRTLVARVLDKSSQFDEEIVECARKVSLLLLPLSKNVSTKNCKCQNMLESKFPRAEALSITVIHLLGQGIQKLSTSQLSLVQEILNSNAQLLSGVIRDRETAYQIELESRIEQLERKLSEVLETGEPHKWRFCVPKRFNFTYPSPKLLKDIVKLPLLATEPAEHIKDIWAVRHENDEARLCLTLDQKVFQQMTGNGINFPNFVIPVHRANGFSVLVSQWQGKKHCLFTGLENFQRNPQNAHPVAVLTFYDEFEKAKGIVLGRIDITDPMVDKKEMQRVLEILMESYLQEHGLERVRTFNKMPDKFDFESFFKSVRPRDL